jgi:hypothetical protein
LPKPFNHAIEVGMLWLLLRAELLDRKGTGNFELILTTVLPGEGLEALICCPAVGSENGCLRPTRKNCFDLSGMTVPVKTTEEVCVGAIRLLSIDMVAKAKSGHPG